MTPPQRALILHALGLTPRGGRMRRWSYRNHYCACVGSEAKRGIAQMVHLGWMEEGRTINKGKSRFYHVTRAGAEAAGVLDRCRTEDLGL